MLGYIYGHDQAVAKFVAQMIPAVRDRGFGPNIVAVGITHGGRMIAGVVYHNYHPDAQVIEMSVAALPGYHWLTRETVKRAYQYPFHQLRCQMVMLCADADDGRLLRQLAALNYTFIRIPRMYGRDHDAVLCLLTQEAWAANKFCQRFKHHLVEQKEAA